MRMYLVDKRQELNMSIRQTVKNLDMDFHHYYRIEMGMIQKVNFLTLCKIARVLDISLDDLYAFESSYIRDNSISFDQI